MITSFGLFFAGGDVRFKIFFCAEKLFILGRLRALQNTCTTICTTILYYSLDKQMLFNSHIQQP